MDVRRRFESGGLCRGSDCVLTGFPGRLKTSWGCVGTAGYRGERGEGREVAV